MKLVITEKKKVAEDIASSVGGFTLSNTGRFFTDGDAILTWARGHLVEEYHPIYSDIKKLPILPSDNDWQLRLINQSGIKDIFDNIKNLAENPKVELIVNACDAAREGELIFHYIYKMLNTDKPVKRMWINSMTKEALQQAYKNTKDAKQYEGLNKAAQCRSKSDWLVGINSSVGVSQVMSRKEGLSLLVPLGRLKNPISMMVYNRQNEIENFEPTPFWEISADFKVGDDLYQGKWLDLEKQKEREKAKADSKKNTSSANEDQDENSISVNRIIVEQKANEIIEYCKKNKITNVLEEKTLKKIHPPKLFDLGSLQVLASELFQISPSKTLEIVQELYEKEKAVTYPRTDYEYLPEDYKGECLEILKKIKKAGLTNIFLSSKVDEAIEGVDAVGKSVFDDKKVGDHFAIIPTGMIPATLPDDITRKIYYLIVQRFKEAFLPPMEYNQTERLTFVGEQAFKSVGKTIITKGWKELGEILSANKEGEPSKKKNEDVILPIVNQADDVSLSNIEKLDRLTTPPAYYTQATLVAAMKGISRTLKGEYKEALRVSGIGTSATRASIIQDLLSEQTANGAAKNPILQEVGKGRKLIATEFGKKVLDFLLENEITALTTPEFTAVWEMELAEVIENPSLSSNFMNKTNDIVNQFISKLQKIYSEIPTKIFEGAVCPECKGKLGVDPKRITCESPNCNFSIPKIIGRKLLNDNDISVLINHGETGQIDGFSKKVTDPKKKPEKFSSALKLEKVDEKYEVKYFFPKNKYDLLCPCCEGEMVSTLNGVSCQNKECGIMFWASRFQKRISDKDMRDLISTGKTSVITGFKSKKTGKNFSAMLVLDKENRDVKLEFDNSDSRAEVETKIKCLKHGCDGKYVKSGLKYVCNSCKCYIFTKIKNGAAFNEAQIKKLFKGEEVVHTIKDFDINGDEIGEKKVAAHISKSEGTLKVSEYRD